MMDKYELKNILDKHNIWLVCCDKDGACADLSYADLSGADLSNVDLRGADLSGAQLRNADLNGADLSGAVVLYGWEMKKVEKLV